MNHHGPIIGMFGGCHRAEGFVAAVIMVFTTWFWRWFKPMDVSTHSSVGFIYADGHREIYESREGKCWLGPIPVEKVEAWVARKPKKRRFTMYDIPAYLISGEAARRKHSRCEDMLFVWVYPIKQLPRMGIRKYLPFLPMKPTPNAPPCSESATIIFDPEVDVCKLVGKSIPDLITPYDFEHAMKAVCAAHRHKPTDTADAYSQ